MKKVLTPIRPINCGQDGAVWLANNGLAIKVPHKDPILAEKEFRVALDLYHSQISVPKPEGLFKILISGEEKTRFWNAIYRK